ncbi:MAG: hypothetical protein NTY05_00990 [Rhodocyclales bacterium]|nr:hypothetical protein [Rhodocyclales bacterium]
METLFRILLVLATSCLAAWVLVISLDATDDLRVVTGTLAIGFAVAAAFFYKRNDSGVAA